VTGIPAIRTREHLTRSRVRLRTESPPLSRTTKFAALDPSMSTGDGILRHRAPVRDPWRASMTLDRGGGSSAKQLRGRQPVGDDDIGGGPAGACRAR